MPTIAPGPSRDQSTRRFIVSLAMISPAKTIAISPVTMAGAFGPMGRAAVVTAGALVAGALLGDGVTSS
jgi:hypothetical protein